MNFIATLFYCTHLEAIVFCVVGFVLGRDYFGMAGTVAVIFVAPLAIYWWRGYCGLDQRPTPHGRYYRQWRTSEGVGDYYRWLAERMQNREPWRSWAASE